jgi:maltooligosyltrehalose trehalohydrolase
LALAANLSGGEIALAAHHTAGRPIWGCASDRLPPWSVCWRLVKAD